MTFTDLVSRMYPYWILGAAILAATANAGLKDLIRVQRSSVVAWIYFLCAATLVRIASFPLLSGFGHIQDGISGVKTIPWAATLTVFWEDASFVLPLVIMKDALIGKLRYLWYPIAFVFAISFASGHLYQGYLASLLTILYLYLSYNMGKKYGFGTVMICHSLYDLFTVLTVKLVS